MNVRMVETIRLLQETEPGMQAANGDSFVRYGLNGSAAPFSIDTLGFLGKRFFPVAVDRNIFYNSSRQGNPSDVSIYRIVDRWSNSLVCDVNSTGEVKQGEELMSPAKRGKAAVGLLYADPMFDQEAMKQNIFRFKPGSPAIKLGIEPIDLSKVGSTLAAPKTIMN